MQRLRKWVLLHWIRLYLPPLVVFPNCDGPHDSFLSSMAVWKSDAWSPVSCFNTSMGQIGLCRSPSSLFSLLQRIETKYLSQGYNYLQRGSGARTHGLVIRSPALFSTGPHALWQLKRDYPNIPYLAFHMFMCVARHSHLQFKKCYFKFCCNQYIWDLMPCQQSYFYFNFITFLLGT